MHLVWTLAFAIISLSVYNYLSEFELILQLTDVLRSGPVYCMSKYPLSMPNFWNLPIVFWILIVLALYICNKKWILMLL